MNERIHSTPLSPAVQGSSVRVVVARDKYTVANISQGMNDREEYARLFAAAPQMLAMLQTIARMDFYNVSDAQLQAVGPDQIEDALATMNSLIESARTFTSSI